MSNHEKTYFRFNANQPKKLYGKMQMSDTDLIFLIIIYDILSMHDLDYVYNLDVELMKKYINFFGGI